jgi:hypothetical protein
VIETRARILGLIGAHEIAHVSGQASERAADLRAVEVLERAHGPVSDEVIRESVRTFDRPIGSSHLSNFINRLKSFVRYGTPGGRIRAMERTARGEADALASYRRADGTLDWKRVTGDRALREVGGLAHFGIALFLKELAVVARSGDRARIEEFFDGLATTDFYKHYGLFVIGARAGEVAYGRYLASYVKPRFVSSILKTNVVLAAVGRATRLARVGGWFYTAAELAVILLIAEDMDKAVNRWLDARAARAALVEAEEAFIAAAHAEGATPESVAEAAAAVHEAWTAYRDFLYRPLEEDDVLFAARLERAAEKAKKTADAHAAALERIHRHPALLRSTIARHGSVEAYAAALVAEEKAELDAQVEVYANSYNASREEHLRQVYEEGRRDGSYLGGVENLSYVLAGAVPGASGDPYEGRRDVIARRGRDQLRRGLRAALGEPSENRLQAYDDELELLNAVRASLAAQGREGLAEALDGARERVAATQTLDDQLIHGNGVVTVDREGAAGNVAEAMGGE